MWPPVPSGLTRRKGGHHGRHLWNLSSHLQIASQQCYMQSVCFDPQFQKGTHQNARYCLHNQNKLWNICKSGSLTTSCHKERKKEPKQNQPKLCAPHTGIRSKVECWFPNWSWLINVRNTQQCFFLFLKHLMRLKVLIINIIFPSALGRCRYCGWAYSALCSWSWPALILLLCFCWPIFDSL